MPFKTPDGKEFATRVEWRDYMMATFYSFKNIQNETAVKRPGEIDGQGFDIGDCDGATLIVMDNCEQVQIDEVKNSRIFIGACASSIFIRNCTNCVFYTACRQLRLRDVKDSNFYIYSMSEVHIEFSCNVRFAPFNGGYPEQAQHFQVTKLDPKQNLWYDVFDHNDPLKSRINWSLIPPAEYEQPWFPAGPCEEVAVPITIAGAVGAPSTSAADSNAGMQSFGFEQLVVDANTTASAKPVPIIDNNIPPPPAPSVPVPADTPEARIRAVLSAYAAYKAGDSKEIFSEDFSSINELGMVFDASSVHNAGSIWAIVKTTISSSYDLATSSLLIETSNGVMRCSAVLVSGGVTGEWKLSSVHCSCAAPSEMAGVPKQ